MAQKSKSADGKKASAAKGKKAGVRAAKQVRARTGPETKGLDKKDIRRMQVRNRIRATMTGTRVFDRTVHKTNIWLKDVMTGMNWDNRERAYSALRASLHAVRDLLSLEETVQLGAQLPMLLRGVYFEGWKPRHPPLRLKSIEDFYGLVRLRLGPGPKFGNNDIRQFSRVCMDVITEHVSAGEMDEVKSILPKRLRSLVPVTSEEDLFIAI
jgi:uncharacterized protein (DUF2267 family)